jgi:antitoxin HigA-1
MLPKRRMPNLPGDILLEDFLRPLNITPKQFAEMLGGKWNEMMVNEIITGHRNIDQEIATQFNAVLNTPTDFWVRLQQHYTSAVKKEHQDEKGSLKPWKKAQ